MRTRGKILGALLGALSLVAALTAAPSPAPSNTGALAMNLTSLATIVGAKPKNMSILLVDNRVYEFTASVPTPTREMDWLAVGRSGDAIGYTFPVVRRRRLALGRIDAELGAYSYDAGTPIAAGTWQSAYWSAQAALTALGVWGDVANKLAPAENVRAALVLVERGAAPLGIVYATDAQASHAVRVVGTFPAASHPPIRYPLALLKTSRSRDAAAFRAFLLARQARAIFARHGFTAP